MNEYFVLKNVFLISENKTSWAIAFHVIPCDFPIMILYMIFTLPDTNTKIPSNHRETGFNTFTVFIKIITFIKFFSYFRGFIGGFTQRLNFVSIIKLTFSALLKKLTLLLG